MIAIHWDAMLVAIIVLELKGNINFAQKKGAKQMKGYVVLKMTFIFMYLMIFIMDMREQLSNPNWASFIYGASAMACLVFIAKNIADIVKKKE